MCRLHYYPSFKGVTYMLRIESHRHNKNIKKIDFIKIDTEEHDLEVLKEASTTFNRNIIQSLQFELYCNIQSRALFKDFLDFFEKLNWKLYRIVVNGIIPIKQYKPSLDYSNLYSEKTSDEIQRNTKETSYRGILSV